MCIMAVDWRTVSSNLLVYYDHCKEDTVVKNWCVLTFVTISMVNHELHMYFIIYSHDALPLCWQMCTCHDWLFASFLYYGCTGFCQFSVFQSWICKNNGARFTALHYVKLSCAPVTTITPIFTGRQHSLLCRALYWPSLGCLSVCLSARHTLALSENNASWDHRIITDV